MPAKKIDAVFTWILEMPSQIYAKRADGKGQQTSQDQI
jgi:hypothetical protein